MKIVLATPLYPPDIAEPAPYVKELACRLTQKHEVTIVTYGRLPEQVPGATIIAVDKRQPLVVRLWAYARTLRRVARTADVIYVQNGPSVELPLLFAPGRKVFHIADTRAHEYASKHLLRWVLERTASQGSTTITDDMPPQKPEILPFVPRPDAELIAWEHAWDMHTEALEKIFHGN